MTSKSQVKVGFEVSFKEPQAHYVEMEMNISGLSKEYIDVKMPVWAPGSYLIREFAKSVEGFSATAGSKALKFEKVRKNAWRIYNGAAKELKIKYRVYAFEVSVRTSFVDDTHAFLSSTGIFMYPDGQLNLPSTVKVNPYTGWTKVSTGLEPVSGQVFTYSAENFDVLFDSPIEVGNQDVFDFMASGVKHTVAMYGGGNYDKERLKVDMAKVVEQATAIYGENPNAHYTFIVHNFERGGGGLEHLNSTVLGGSRDGYGTPEGYNSFLDLVAHEYHHLWNVKRMRPVALGPFDYDNENYTTNLWVAEGFTSYYENKLMLRAGFNTPETFVSNLATALANVNNTPGSRVQSAAEASYDAWIKSYRPNENSNNATISYYGKGEIIGLIMDLEISQATKGVKSLDDVMKAMYLEGKAKKRGYTDAEFKAKVEQISGKDFSGFWEKYVNGTVPVEYDKYFEYAGITVVDENKGNNIPYVGVTSKASNGIVFISAVSRNSAAWLAGLNVNDAVVSVNGEVTSGAPLERSAPVTSAKVGDVITVSVLREGVLRDFKLTIKANPNLKLNATIRKDASAGQLKVRKGWMGI